MKKKALTVKMLMDSLKDEDPNALVVIPEPDECYGSPVTAIISKNTYYDRDFSGEFEVSINEDPPNKAILLLAADNDPDIRTDEDIEWP